MQVDEKGYHLPRTCPFAKEMDMYLDNELHKKEARFGNWRCPDSIYTFFFVLLLYCIRYVLPIY